jgi:hypothetical protein
MSGDGRGLERGDKGGWEVHVAYVVVNTFSIVIEESWKRGGKWWGLG